MKKILLPLLGVSLVANLWLAAWSLGLSRTARRSEQKAEAARLSEETFRSNYFVWEIGINPVSTYVRQSDGASLTLSNDYFAVLEVNNQAWRMHWDQLDPRLLRVGANNYKIWDMQGDLIDTRGDHWKKVKQ